MFRRKREASRPDSDWIHAAYAAMLGREAERDGFEHWRDFLAGGGDPRALLERFSGSAEFVNLFAQRCKTFSKADVVRAAYLGLMGRDPDDGGNEHWQAQLGDVRSIVDMLELFTTSDEFMRLFEERRRAREANIEANLRAPAKRIAILANCQGENIARCMQALTGTQPPRFVMSSAEFFRDRERCADPVRGLYASVDLVLVQPLFAEHIHRHFPEVREKSVLMPSISFAAFQPDQCYVTYDGTLSEVQGPLGPYHSSIAYHAWRTGLSVKQALRLFRGEVYEDLRFFDYWDSSTRALRDEGERAGVDLDGLLQKWRMRGCFMFSVSHPKLHVLADVARLMLGRLGLPMLPIEPEELVYDAHAAQSVWPVYPEIGARYGIPGHYIFKDNNPGVPGRSPVVLYDLEEFVGRSFEAYADVSQRAAITCHREFTDRYRDAFAKATRVADAPARAPAAPTAPPRPADHPYARLPDHQYWRKAMAGVPAAEIDPVVAGDFRIDRGTAVATAGSCFAQHIARHLRRQGFRYLDCEPAPATLSPAEAARANYGVYSARFGNLYTARQLVQLFDRAYGRFVPLDTSWQRPDGRHVDPFRPEVEPAGYASAADVEAAREAHLAAVRAMFEQAELFVFTLGLTECWSRREDGAVFPIAPGVTAGRMDPADYAFLNFDVATVKADLEGFVARLREVNPRARLLFTVSPVPLAATFEPEHVLNATTYSKAVLRAAAGEITRTHGHCHYFPSYEIITGNHSRGLYYQSDLRSVTESGVDHVMRLFFRHYTPGLSAGPTDAELQAEVNRSFKIVCEEELLDQAGGLSEH